jgi:hypothetical protein
MVECFLAVKPHACIPRFTCSVSKHRDFPQTFRMMHPYILMGLTIYFLFGRVIDTY